MEKEYKEIPTDYLKSQPKEIRDAVIFGDTEEYNRLAEEYETKYADKEPEPEEDPVQKILDEETPKSEEKPEVPEVKSEDTLEAKPEEPEIKMTGGVTKLEDEKAEEVSEEVSEEDVDIFKDLTFEEPEEKEEVEDIDLDQILTTPVQKVDIDAIAQGYVKKADVPKANRNYIGESTIPGFNEDATFTIQEDIRQDIMASDLGEELRDLGVDYPTTKEEHENLERLDKGVYRKLNKEYKDRLNTIYERVARVKVLQDKKEDLSKKAWLNSALDFAEKMKKMYDVDLDLQDDKLDKLWIRVQREISASEDQRFWKDLGGLSVPSDPAIWEWVVDHPEVLQVLKSYKSATSTDPSKKQSAQKPSSTEQGTGQDTSVDGIPTESADLTKALQDMFTESSKILAEDGFIVDLKQYQPEERKEFQNILRQIGSDKGNPLYWEGGKLKPSAFADWMWINRRPQMLAVKAEMERKAVQSEFEKAEAERKAAEEKKAEDLKKAEVEFLKDRKGPEFPSQISSEQGRSQSGGGVTLPSPDKEWLDYRYMNKYYARLAEAKGITDEQARELVKKLIDAQPEDKRKLYYQ